MARLSAWSALLERTRNAVEFYDTAREESARSILVDSSKSIYRFLHIQFMRPREVLAVYLTREGRAVMNSLMKTGYSAREAARRWWRANSGCFIASRLSVRSIWHMKNSAAPRKRPFANFASS